MIAVDANVLVRFLVSESGAQDQVVAARAALHHAGQTNERVFIPLVTLVETVWVLRRSYRQPKAIIVSLLERLLDSGAMLIEEGELVQAAVSAWKEGPGDFSDHVIGQEALRWGCRVVLFFDHAMHGVPLFQEPAPPPEAANT